MPEAGALGKSAGRALASGTGDVFAVLGPSGAGLAAAGAFALLTGLLSATGAAGRASPTPTGQPRLSNCTPPTGLAAGATVGFDVGFDAGFTVEFDVGADGSAPDRALPA